MFLYGVLCVLIGALITIFVMTDAQVSKMVQQTKQLEQTLVDMDDTLDKYINDRDTIIKSFAEMESRFTRLEHMMRVPRSARRETWKELEANEE